MDNVQQGPPQPKDDLVTHIAKVIREDISIGHFCDHIQLRQPPINEDDHDSWAYDHKPLENWLYLASEVIKAVDRYRTPVNSEAREEDWKIDPISKDSYYCPYCSGKRTKPAELEPHWTIHRINRMGDHTPTPVNSEAREGEDV